MIFPSYVFLLGLLPAVVAVWRSRLPLETRLAALTVASYIFYGWWDYRFTGLMVVSTALDWVCGGGIAASPPGTTRRRLFLLASVAGNLGILGLFKYYGFFSESLKQALAVLGLSSHLPTLSVVLPIGISFYTFQTMSYSIDIYRGAARPAPSLLHFAAYVSMFPQLVAGPIVRYGSIAGQLERLRERGPWTQEQAYGVWLFVMGMCKKLLIADRLAPAAQALYDSTAPVQLGGAWYGSLSYTLQLYFDFSGYSDMALGLGLLLGFKFPINFDSPYKARNISDFWNRWHISLSHFLRDYLFIPLGGSRGSTLTTVRNLGITMVLGGLWHGAQWTFVVWGLYHGVLLAANATGRRLGMRPWARPVAVLATFLAVHLGWVLFRAPTFGRAWEVLGALAGAAGIEPSFAATYASVAGPMPLFIQDCGGLRSILQLLAGLAIVFAAPNLYAVRRWHHPVMAVVTAILATACLFSLAQETPFLYYQF